ncbi:hypothetical protein G9A89_006194 [Geosiphon pyriformis]|nr:hypothetical protein G9A89_006194 [Geosiphon pyriformis]
MAIGEKILASKLAAIGSTPVFKGVNLHWTGLSLVCCARCKQFGHISVNCAVDENPGGHSKWMVIFQNCVHLANIYKKKQVPIAYSVSFGDKTWAQIAGGFSSYVILSDFFGPGLSLGVKLIPMVFNPLSDSCLVDYLAFLDHFLKLLVNQVPVIMKKLSFVELVLLTSKFYVLSLVTPAFLASDLDSDMALNNILMFFIFFLSVIANIIVDFSSSSSKVLTTKMSGLEFKLVALEVSVELVLESVNVFAKQNDVVCWHMKARNMNKFNSVWVFTSGLNAGFFGTGVVIIINNSLAYHVSTVEKVSGWLIFQYRAMSEITAHCSAMWSNEKQLTLNPQGKIFIQNYFNIPAYQETTGRLQTPVVIPKQIQLPTWKKTRVESLTNLSYHYILESTINISSTGASTLHAISTFGQLPFQKFQSLPPQPDFGNASPWEITESEEKKKKESEDQEFTYQNLITKNLEQPLQPLQQPQQPLQLLQQQLHQPPQQQIIAPIAYALIIKLKKFTGKENDAKSIAANSWNDARAINNNSINRLANTFTTIKQGENEAVTTYLEHFYKNLCQIQAIQADYFTVPQILNQFIRGLRSNILQCVCPMHPADLQAAVTNARDFEAAELEANHA